MKSTVRICAAIFLTIISIHLLPVFHGDLPEAFALSVEEERVLGQEFMAKIRKQFNVVDDDFANEYINDLGQYLITPLEIQYFPFRFFVIRDNRFNAFAAPGGNIFVFSGLIEAMERVDELAAVLCHEIAHVSARHLAERIEQSKKIGLASMAGVLAGALIGGKAGSAAAAGSVAAGIQTQLYYSRDDERQADQLGFKYMDLTGFDPGGMIITLNKIEKGSWAGMGQMPAYLLTHPTGPERMGNLDSLLRGHTRRPESRAAAGFRDHFPFFQAALRAGSMAPHEAEATFEAELKQNASSAAAHFGLGLVMRDRDEYDLAIDHFQAALKEKPDSLPILKELGEMYQLNNQDADAIAVLAKALKIDPNDKSTMFALAKTCLDLEDYPRAIRLYERLVQVKPVRDEVYHNLGVAYGREGRLGLAHYNFGKYFKEQGNLEKARFHFRKAEELSTNDPSLQNRIQRAREELPLK